MRQQYIILTMDKDLGYLIYHQKMHPYGIFLLKIHPQSPEIDCSTILHILNLKKNKISI